MRAVVPTMSFLEAAKGHARRGPDVAFVRRWRAVLATYLIFAAVVCAYYVGVKGESRSAINRWRPVVREMWTGTDIYLVRGFPTPPIMPILLTPFCQLDGKLAMTAWFGFKAACTGLVLFWMLRAGENIAGGLPSWAGMVGLVLAARPIMGDLLHGNVNLWILFLVVGAVVAYRADRDLVSGLLLSLAIACKLTPALVAVYFAWKREWRVTSATLAGLIVWLLLAPASLLGWHRNVELLDHWADYMVWPYLAEGQVDTSVSNQSAAGLVHRWLSPTPQAARERSPTMAREFDTTTVGWIWKGSAATLVALVGFACRGRLADRSSPRMWHELGLVFLTMLLLSERSWKHHFVWLLPIALVLSATAVKQGREDRGGWRHMWTWWSLGGAFLLMLSTSTDVSEAVTGGGTAKLFQSWGAYVWAALILMSSHIVALWGRGRLRDSAI